MPGGHYSGPSGPGGPKPPTKFEAGRFVAWDGEGSYLCGCPPSWREGPWDGAQCRHAQDYVYLLNSAGGELVDEKGIDTRTALAALAGEGRRLGSTVTHVCFGLSYDANQFLRDVPREALRRLWKGDRVRLFRRFKVAYRSRKSLWVKDYSTGASVTVWDVFGFYQSPFVNAVEENLGKSDPRLPLIRQGKARRGEFALKDLPFIRRYTGAEVAALVDLCRHLRESFVAAGLVLKRWDGAGAAAASLLDREGVKKHLNRDVPTAVHEASLYAYAGGRAETRLYGYHVGPIYHGDIRSAYPNEARHLPSLREGRWVHDGPGVLPDPTLSVVKVRWNYARLGDGWDLLPFAFRSHTGAIYFPRKGTTWAWRPEVDAALRFPELRRKTELLDAWSWRPKDGSLRPFAFMERVYRDRMASKRGRGAHKALKLSPNAVYGKLAQNVGGTEERPPPYHQLEYAGYITSATRARLYLAARAIPSGVVTLATDGIYSTEPLAGLVASEELGGWDLDVHEAMLIAQSGVYWYRKATRRGGHACDECGGPVEDGALRTARCLDATCRWTSLVRHYRGFDEDSLDPETILTAWRKKRTSVQATSTRFVTLGRAVTNDETFGLWRRWVQEPRVLDIRACGKRVDRTGGRASRPDREFVETDPAQPFETVSSPYALAWAAERGEESTMAQEQSSLR